MFKSYLCILVSSLFFLTLLWPFSLLAEVLIKPIPYSASFYQKQSRTFNILQALYYENKHLNKKSYLIWQSFTDKETVVYDHLFINRLSAWPLAGTGNTRGVSPLLLARYQLWKGDLDEAFQLLDIKMDSTSDQMEKALEKIRIHLLRREYGQADKLLLSLTPNDQKMVLQKDILRSWLNVLTEKWSDLKKNVAKIRENYLYLSPSLYIPLNKAVPAGILNGSIRQAFLWFPSDKSLKERILIQGDPFRIPVSKTFDIQWNEDDITRQNSSFIAGLYLREGKYRQLDNFIKEQTLKPNPRNFEIRAQLAIKNKDWEELERVAKQYQRKFPALSDPKIYLAEYYKQTGQTALAQITNQSLPELR